MGSKRGRKEIPWVTTQVNRDHQSFVRFDSCPRWGGRYRGGGTRVVRVLVERQKSRHDHVRLPVFVATVPRSPQPTPTHLQAHDIRMFQRAQNLHFAQRRFPHGRVVVRFLELLHRHELARVLVPALQHHPVRALAHHPEHLVLVHTGATPAVAGEGGIGEEITKRRNGFRPIRQQLGSTKIGAICRRRIPFGQSKATPTRFRVRHLLTGRAWKVDRKGACGLKGCWEGHHVGETNALLARGSHKLPNGRFHPETICGNIVSTWLLGFWCGWHQPKRHKSMSEAEALSGSLAALAVEDAPAAAESEASEPSGDPAAPAEIAPGDTIKGVVNWFNVAKGFGTAHHEFFPAWRACHFLSSRAFLAQGREVGAPSRTRWIGGGRTSRVSSRRVRPDVNAKHASQTRPRLGVPKPNIRLGVFPFHRALTAFLFRFRLSSRRLHHEGRRTRRRVRAPERHLRRGVPEFAEPGTGGVRA